MRIKKVLAFALSMIMIISMLPVGVIASNETNETLTVSGQFIVENFKEGTAESSVEIQIYSETAENYFCSRKAVLGDDNTWSVEFPADYVGEYYLLVMPYSYGNVFPGEYEYADEEGVPIPINLDGEDVSGIKMSLPTGRMISGTIELPDDAVLPEKPIECGVYADAFGNGTYDKYFSNVTIKEQSTAFDIVVDYSEKSVILAAEPWLSNENTNLLNDTVFYVNNEASSTLIDNASELAATDDVTGVKLYLTTGNVLNIKLNRPESIETGNIYGRVMLLDEEGNEIDYQVYRFYTDPYSSARFSLSKEYDKVYVSFYADCSYVSIKPYSGTLYLNPDGSIVKTLDEAKMHTLNGLTSLEFTVPDEYFFSPKIKGTVYFEQGAFAENTEISVALLNEYGSEYTSKELFDNFSSSGTSESEELSNGLDFEFVFTEGSSAAENKYAIAVEISNYTIGKTNIYAGSDYYYIENGAVLDIKDADMITPASTPTKIAFNIPIMKELTGTIVPDGEFKYINEETDAAVLFWCAHNEGSSSGGTSSGTVSGETASPQPVSDIFEITDSTENVESECPLDHFYYSKAVIYKDMTFSCYVPTFLCGEHRIDLRLENSGTNLMLGDYFYTNEQGENLAVDFSNGTTDEDINIDVDTGYAVSGVVKMPIGGTFEASSNVKEFETNIVIQCYGDTVETGINSIELTNTVRECPFMFAVDKENTDEFYIYSVPVNGYSYTNLKNTNLYYVDDKTTSETESDALIFSVNGDIEDLVFNLQTDGTEEITEYTYNFKVYDNSVASASLIPIKGATVSITDGENFSYMCESGDDGAVEAKLILGKTYNLEVSKDGYATYAADFEATLENAEKTNYIPLTTATVEQAKTHAFFVVLDKDTQNPVSGAEITVYNSGNGSTVLGTSDEGTTNAYFEYGTYEIVTSKDGYVTDRRNVELMYEAQEVVIEIEKIEISVEDNTTFYVKDGDLESTPAISGASLTIEDAEGNIITKSTDSDGKAGAELEDGTYYVTAIADGYKTRTFKIDRTDSKNNFTVYLNKDDIITVKSSVKEMTPEEMEQAGIDTDNIGNKQVYNCTAVLSFMPHVSINYYYDSDGGIVKGKTPVTVHVDNTSITPVGRDIYLIVKSSTTWLKETFEVQIVCDNTSAVETVEDLTANLTIPEGLSLAIMTEGMVNDAIAVLGDVLPKGTTSHKWYITGDKEGEYSLDGTLTGTRTGGGISENINLTFGIEDSINVLAGSALKLTIDAETHGIVGEPYYMRYTLENASEKTLYDLSFSVFGGKFFEDFGVKEVKYAKEYGPNAIEDLDGKGFVFETEEFKPDDKVQGVFEIKFGEELLLGEGQEWILKKAFVITGAGSTTEIPVIINWEYDVPAHDWKEGVVTKAATCTEDGIMTYECKDEDCEETYTERISATGHNMGEYITVQPTCTSEGSMTSRCQNDGCDHTVVLPLAKADHAWKTDYTIDKKPTCTEKGSKSIHCENCSATTDVQEVKETGHNYGTWQTRTAATCEGTGEDYRVCANGCNIEETRTVASLGHDYAIEWTVDIAAKCEEKGSESRHCSRCSATTDNRDIPETGHSFTEWKTRTEAQCETKGEEYRICQNGCGKEETKPIDELGHDWDDGTITKNPTETETGNKLYTCKRCPATKNETLPMLIKQDVGFTVPEMTYTYGDKEAIYNEAYNDSEDGSELTYSSSNENVATVDKDGKVTIIGAGETTITATAAATDKYLETTESFKLTIKKASLTIMANDAEIYYGEEGKNNGFTATGFVLGETETVIKGTPVYEVNYKQFDKVGEYEITVDELTADNYEITFKSGKLTVKKAEVYNIEFSNLSQRKGKISEVTASVTPKDETAKIKIEYQFTDGVWVDTIPSDIGIGEYKVRAYLTESENLAINEAPKYFESILEIKAGAVVNLDGNSDLSIDSNVSGDNVEFTIPDAAVEEIINNVPESGEIVIDATGSTEGVTNLTLPENIVTALDESENVNTFTVIADDAEISMSADVLKTVAEEMSAGDKVNVHIEAVEKESLNEEQKAALDAITTDAHVLQLKLEVQKQDGTTELHELNGNVEVKAAYTLPADMNGKKIVVCYVSDNGTVTYMRATYKDGFVHFKTDHFSHYAIAAIECTHTWDAGTVITQATTSSEGLKRYECTICGETKDETIPKKSGYVGGGGSTASYTVKFDTNGAGTIKSQTISKNSVVPEPTAPTKEGYTFAGWYTDKELTVAYDFASKVTKNFTLFAKWAEIEKEPEEDKPETSMEFTDVKSTDWFFDSVKYVADNKLMNGVSETEFAPDNTLTRAMLVTVLYRNAGEPATNRSIPFADVDMGAYYANAVSWAKQNGIVSGVTENEFAPDANITREQIATIMFRYAQYKGYDVSVGENTNILSYDDFDNISEYAIASMQYACGSGLMKGKTASTLNPKDNATRAEIAAILHRFIEANK